MIAFNAIHAEFSWELSNDGTLTISGTEMSYSGDDAPWYSQKNLIKKVVIKYGVTNICYGAFRYCKNITSVTIPESVTIIDKYAFYSCSSLISITIPKSVMYIQNYAFAFCTGLTSITCERTSPPTCKEASCFQDVDTSIPVYVPENYIWYYKTYDVWKKFSNIQAIIPNSFTFTDEAYHTFSSLCEGRDISYTRTFNNNNWQALYIPFSIDYDHWKNDFDIAYINGIRQLDTNDDNVIDETIMDIYRIESGSLIPNTPYLIRAKTLGEKTISVSNATLYPDDNVSIDCSTTIARYIFTGTYRPIPAATLIANEYYAMGGGAVIMTDGESDLKPFRWYMRIEARSPIYNVANAAKTITIKVMGEKSETTGVRQLQIANDELPVYDLNGRKVNENSLKPGLYIKNGKKVVIK